uniref:Uncharacterized protein n=1 Tax=Vannella robusta TaxID=1487602 RepID=A0A7S4IPL5_9EUKA|mmetsp:Transcript_6155/g.7594  ORF Transcript_6155/g.7594 Transcript_6155/m.7594 type:complete len:421 (+) Transcript_6155:651-1913(+)
MKNSVKHFSMSGDILGSTSTAIGFTSVNSASTFELIGSSFTSCRSEDSAPALSIDTKGEIRFTDLSFYDTEGDCGAVSIRLHDTTNFQKTDSPMKFVNTRARRNGGAICLKSSSPSVFIDLGTFDFSMTSCDNNGGAIYIEGPGKFRLADFVETVDSSAMNYGAILYAKEVTSIEIANSVFVSPVLSTSSSMSGSFYIQDSEYFFMTNVTVDYRNAVQGDGGIASLHNLKSVTVTDSSFTNGGAAFGVGGAFLLDSITSFEIQNSEFHNCVARKGAAIACMGESRHVDISGVSFYNSVSTELDKEHVDVFSDGSCLSSFWDSQSPCPEMGKSCKGSVNSLAMITADGDGQCFCYCGDSLCGETDLHSAMYRLNYIVGSILLLGVLFQIFFLFLLIKRILQRKLTQPWGELETLELNPYVV